MTLLEDKAQVERSTQAILHANSYAGLAIAGIIITVWLTSLIALLRLDSQQHPVWLGLAVLWQTFLYAGLFITAHDAMHTCVVPQHPKLNHFMGGLALLLYGWLPYRKLRKAHWQHHQQPASEHDPDFHDGQYTHRLLWYVRFMRRYWGWWQFLAIMGTYHFLSRVLHVAEMNLMLFWAVPSLLSSLQLFYFGTFLAHREPANGYQNPFRSNSIYRPFFWSLLTCYHFGYHREHHEYPHVPWWQLPGTSIGHNVFLFHSGTLNSLCKDEQDDH